MKRMTISGGSGTIGFHADDQRVLCHRDSDVLAGSCAAALSRLVCRARSTNRLAEPSVLRGSLPRRAMALVLE